MVEFPILRREPKKARLLLEEMEEHRSESVQRTMVSVEQVYPQNDDDNDDSTAMGTWVDTIGNLTLLEDSFPPAMTEFKQRQLHLVQSTTRLNAQFASYSNWTITEIKERGLKLAEEVAQWLPRPHGEPYVPPEVSNTKPGVPVNPKPIKGGLLKIVIRWSIFGQDRMDQEICRRTSVATLVEFLAVFIRALEPELAKRLERIPVIRKWPLSRNPMRDFLNGKTGQPYPHKPIPGTELFVCTNSQTDEKAADLRSMVVALGLDPECFEFGIVDKDAIWGDA